MDAGTDAGTDAGPPRLDLCATAPGMTLIEDEIVDRSSGRPPSHLYDPHIIDTTHWSIGSSTMALFGGRIWLGNGTAEDPAWRLRTTSFIPAATGEPQDMLTADEPDTTWAMSGQVGASRENVGVCYMSSDMDRPMYRLNCGRLEGDPGTFHRTFVLDEPGPYSLGAYPDGFAVAHTGFETHEQALILANAKLEQTGRVLLATEANATVASVPVVRTHGQWWPVVGLNDAPNMLTVYRVGDDLRIEGTADIAELRRDPMVGGMEVWPVGAYDGMLFAAHVSNGSGGASELYLGCLRADGTTHARRVLTTTTESISRPVLFRYTGGWAIVYQRNVGMEHTVAMLRVGPEGEVLEAPFTVRSEPGVSLSAAGADASGATWILYSVMIAEQTFDNYVVRVDPGS